MKSKVYFIAVKDIGNVSESLSKLDMLIMKSQVLADFCAGWNVAVKTHFGAWN